MATQAHRIIAALCALAAGPALAEAPPAALAPMLGAGAKAKFIGMAGELRGYVVTRRRPDGTIESFVSYVTPDGSLQLLGRAFDATGADETARQLARLGESLGRPGGLAPLDVGAPAGTAGKASEEAFSRRVSAETACFTVGEGAARRVFLLTAPAARGGEAARAALAGRLAEGSVAVTVVLTSGGPGPPDAAALLSAPDPAARWYAGRPADREPMRWAEALVEMNDRFAATLPVKAEAVAAFVSGSGQWEFADMSTEPLAAAAMRRIDGAR